MTINLTLPPEIESQIVATAERYHIPVEAYLLSLVESALPKRLDPAPLAGESNHDFATAMRGLSKTSNPVSLPYQTWTRAEIYQDHD